MAWSNLHAHALLDGHGFFVCLAVSGEFFSAFQPLLFSVVVGCASMARAEIQPSSDIFERRRETEHMDFLFLRLGVSDNPQTEETNGKVR
jgi:hypothetical protein